MPRVRLHPLTPLLPALDPAKNRCFTFADAPALRLSLDFRKHSNGRQAVGDGAFYTDATPDVLAVCHMQGTNDMYYYSTTFSGGPGVRHFLNLFYCTRFRRPSSFSLRTFYSLSVVFKHIVALLTRLRQNALLTGGRWAV